MGSSVLKGTGDGGITTQSEGRTGQRMMGFIITIFAANLTMGFATWLHAPLELSVQVVTWICVVGIVLVLGRTGVHIAEAWAQSKLGKMESRTVTESTVTQTPPKKK